MMPLGYRIARLVVAATIAMVLPGQLARGQDDDETEIKVEVDARQRDREDLILLQRHRVLLSQKRAVDTWIAGRFQTITGLKGHLEKNLASRLEDLRAACNLTELQLKKLQLAGRGDIKRFMDRLDSTMQECTRTGAVDLQIIKGVVADLQEGAERPFETGSLFDKTLVTTLSPQQVVAPQTWPIINKQSRRRSAGWRNS
jgi:hypothetical protein